ncbi:MAG TPA: DUF4214 domain-containing protein [Thermoanaerobaculia bacterium]|nr:DUF4214 domain-containing protein [Thermoanaerobaculia bacterium]
MWLPRQRIVLRVALLLSFASATPSLAAVPHQFVAKQYTEILGRIPDQGGWAGSVSHFNVNGCSKSSLKSFGRSFYSSSEFTSLGYDNAAKVLILYRAILNREPDSGGFTNYFNLLNAGTPLLTIVDAFYDSAEFGGLVSPICNKDSYGFGAAPVINLPVTTGGFQGTQAQLQATLNATPSGGTVSLAQKAVVKLTSALTVPAGVTLTTLGTPDHYHYALMGRLVRDSLFAGPSVKLMGGAKLKNVWVDDSGGRLGHSHAGQTVQLFGGAGTTVSQCVIGNPSGWSSLQTLGSAEGWPCASNQIDHNLITAYSSCHFQRASCSSGCELWADGLSLACENTTAEYNETVDATDVHIVVFRAHPAVQRSQVRFNTALAAGNSSYGGIVADPLGPAGATYDFNGTSIHDNTFWSGRGHYDIGLSVGTRAWFGTNSATGTGASFTGNNTGTQRAIVDVGIGVSGMLNVTVQSNSLLSTLSNSGACPNGGTTVNVGASVSAGFASGSIQSYSDLLIQGCIGHATTCPP